MTTRTFDEMRTIKQGRTKGCPRCGAARNAGSVQIHLQSLTDTGQLKARVCSRAKSLCESCCVEVYELALAVLLSEAKEESA